MGQKKNNDEKVFIARKNFVLIAKQDEMCT